MSEPYSSLNLDEQNAHLSVSSAGYSMPYASGEAHFFDVSQTTIAYNGDIVNSGLFDRNGLLSDFSSGPQSRNYAITDFKAFNPYRHYVTSSLSLTGQDAAYQINISALLQKSTYNFNIYSTSFRTIATTPHST